MVEPVTFNAVRAAVLPTAPDKVTGAVVPTALRVRGKTPLIVPPKEIPPAPVVVIVVSPDRTVGTALVTVNKAALIAEDPRVTVFVVPAAEDTVTAPRGTVLPRAPLKLIPPTTPASRVRDCPFVEIPSTVPPKYIPVGSERPAIVPRVVIVVLAEMVVGTELLTFNEAAAIDVAKGVKVTCDAAEMFNAPIAALPPMIPLKVTGAGVPVLRVRDCAYAVVAFNVPPNAIPSLPVVLIVVFADNTVGTELTTVNEDALIAVAPIELDPRVTVFVVPEAEETVSAPRG